MNFIVFDLEWNQAPGGRLRENPKIPFEILEIGAVKLNGRRKIVGHFHETVKPLVYTRMNRYTQKVVHMDMSELKKSRTFSPVARSFLSWCGRNPVFVTWGPSDLFELQRNLDYYHIQYRFPKPLLYVDLQKLYSLGCLDGKKRPALHEAVEAMQIEQDRPFHAAFDDAWYTAQIMRKLENFKNLLPYKSVDYYHLPENPKEEFTLDFKTYSKFVSMLYPDKETALKSESVTSLCCHRCGRPLLPRINWFSGAGGSMYYALGDCVKHGPEKGKLRIRKGAGEEVYIVKTIKSATEKDVAEIEERRQTAQERRHRRMEKEKEKRRARRQSSQGGEAAAKARAPRAHGKARRRRGKKPNEASAESK